MASFEEELEEYTRVTLEARELKKKEKELKARAKNLLPRLLEEFARRGWSTGPRLAGLGLPHLHKDRRARVVREGEDTSEEEWDRACDALEAAGMADVVGRRFNLNTLSAYFREWDRDGKDPPEELAGVLEFEDVYDIRVKGGS